MRCTGSKAQAYPKLSLCFAFTEISSAILPNPLRLHRSPQLGLGLAAQNGRSAGRLDLLLGLGLAAQNGRMCRAFGPSSSLVRGSA
ncbi:hypothetical protein U1Q18_002856 [Sarracenia purpurea var. burkii]